MSLLCIPLRTTVQSKVLFFSSVIYQVGECCSMKYRLHLFMVVLSRIPVVKYKILFFILNCQCEFKFVNLFILVYISIQHSNNNEISVCLSAMRVIINFFVIDDQQFHLLDNTQAPKPKHV